MAQSIIGFLVIICDCSPYVILFHFVIEKEDCESNVGKIKDSDSPQINKEIRDEVCSSGILTYFFYW